jgi:hypothetical protein
MNQKRLPPPGLGLPSDLEFVSPELFAYLKVENRSRRLRPKASPHSLILIKLMHDSTIKTLRQEPATTFLTYQDHPKLHTCGLAPLSIGIIGLS